MTTCRTPGGDDIPEDDGPIGLALSGVGLKASLFHIGVLARLAELDLLRRIDVISATSGGALAAALYFLRLKRALDADGDIDSGRLMRLVGGLERHFLKTVQTDLRTRLADNPFANLKRVSAQHSDAARLGELLEHHLFRPVWNGDPDRPIEMRELAITPRGDRDFNPITDNRQRYCKAPVLIINATNLDSGRAWRFDTERMGEPPTGPAARRLSKAPLLAQNPYRRLPERYGAMTLGHAVAASMAAPGILEPLRLHRLYPDPEDKGTFLKVRLGDGQIADPLGTEPLAKHGCTRMIIADASGFETFQNRPNDHARTLQLEALEARRPGGVVLIHLLSEIEALEVQPLGPVERGQVVKDRHDQDVTSYGVERRLQKLIASMRADIDAPSEVEAHCLAADGYLIAKRALQQHRHRGHGWVQGTLEPSHSSWRFKPLIDPMAKPSKKLLKHLKTARFASFRAPRLAIGQAVSLVMLAVVAVLALLALGTSWVAIRPVPGADQLWIIANAALLAGSAWLAGRHFGAKDRAEAAGGTAGRISGWIGKVQAILSALPRAVAARFRHRASRAFLEAGQLKTIGIEPIKAQKRRKPEATLRPPVAEPTKKAA